jgi:hypothetical protein
LSAMVVGKRRAAAVEEEATAAVEGG